MAESPKDVGETHGALADRYSQLGSQAGGTIRSQYVQQVLSGVPVVSVMPLTTDLGFAVLDRRNVTPFLRVWQRPGPSFCDSAVTFGVVHGERPRSNSEGSNSAPRELG